MAEAISASGLKPLVSIMIVAFNSRDFIGTCLDAVAAGARETPHEILLIDNGEDGTARYVAGRHADVRVVEGQGNTGFARGNNLLAEQATAPLLLLVNPDVVVQPGAIDALVQASRDHPQAAAWGGVTLDAEGAPDTGNAVAVPSLLRLSGAVAGLALRRGNRGFGHDADVPMLSGGFVLLNRQAWDAAGGFDERFFLYCEEVDLFERLKRQGWHLHRVAAARARHAIAHGESLAPRRLLFMTAGTMEFLRKHRARPAQAVGAGLIWLAALLRYVAGVLFGRWHGRWRALGQGYRLVALRPQLWWHGYDLRRGLTVQLGMRRESER